MQDYIFTLFVDRKKVDQSLIKVLKNLPNLTTLVLQNDEISQDKNRKIFQVDQLGRALQGTGCLCSLSLSNCEFDDDLVRLLLLALDENTGDTDIRTTLVHLDVVSLAFMVNHLAHN